MSDVLFMYVIVDALSHTEFDIVVDQASGLMVRESYASLCQSSIKGTIPKPEMTGGRCFGDWMVAV
jgi:hypothetical protein